MAPVTRYAKETGQGIHRLVRSVELATVARRDRQHVKMRNRVAQDPATRVLEPNHTCAGSQRNTPSSGTSDITVVVQ